MTEANGLRERVRQHDRYLFNGENSVSQRLHSHGRFITEQKGKLEALQEDVKELKEDDIAELRAELRSFRDDFAVSQRGLTKAEKIALAGAGSAVVMAVLGTIALLAGP